MILLECYTNANGWSIFAQEYFYLGDYVCEITAITSQSQYHAYSFNLTILAQTVPDPPTALTAIPGSLVLSSMVLSWTIPVFDGGSPITEFEIWWEQGGTGSWYIYGKTTETSYSITGLTEATIYNFVVRANNSIGSSLNSSRISFPLTVPDPPTGFTGIAT